MGGSRGGCGKTRRRERRRESAGRGMTHAPLKAAGWETRLTLFKLFLRTVIMHWSVCNPKFS